MQDESYIYQHETDFFFLSDLKVLFILLSFILFYEGKVSFFFQAASKIDVKMFFSITLEGKTSD